MVASLSVRSRSVLAALVATLGLLGAPNAQAVGPFLIECQYLDSTPSFASVLAAWHKIVPPSNDEIAEAKKRSELGSTDCQRLDKKQVLVGPGDIVVVVDEAHYTEALEAAGDKAAHLFLNGFDLGGQGALVSVEREKGKVALRLHAGSRKEGSEKFWSAIYEKYGLIGEGPLRAAVGWGAEPVFVLNGKNPPTAPDLRVAVTSWSALVAATLLLVLVLGSFVLALWKTDIFRIAPIFPWWRDARALQRHLQPILAGSSVSQKAQEILDAIRSQTTYATFEWPTDKTAAAYCEGCVAIAAKALAQRRLADGQQLRVVVGLGVDGKTWRPIRLPYSLARVQSGAWLIFAIGAAIYLWLVYGEFPALEGSVLGLVAISAATTGGSLLVDTGKPKTASLSQNFFYDLLTDPDDIQQAHRYQALVVNIMLLVVGVTYVVQHLLYPTFDASWLGLLGVSGIAQTLGKQAVERGKDDPAPATPGGGGGPATPVDPAPTPVNPAPTPVDPAPTPVDPTPTPVETTPTPVEPVVPAARN